ncbi:unnamed protein product [Cylindrotheca closterium]|uniref:Deacetylase sirtuin-type domain-containing protein n=1 Tax=Cylindrotheca closterium TaxID=2856 RepID=A0AAD2FEX1_9STRA|nr:unnamed protein product [Cylindrotheca closterium]
MRTKVDDGDDARRSKQEERAARALKEADVLLLVTGAGFSADSGLAVYNDIGKVEAYQLRNLDYADICQPRWLKKDPELFYGFWGQCFNDYRNTKPHDGYQILRNWRDDKNLMQHQNDHGTTTVADEIRTRTLHKYHLRRPFDDDAARLLTPYKVDHEDINQIAGSFFAFTSNVDAHHYDVFEAHEIHDCHGNIELWQCSNRGCETGIWRAPIDHKFVVDKEWMLAPKHVDANANDGDDGNDGNDVDIDSKEVKEEKDGSITDKGDSDNDNDGPAKVGHIKATGEKRSNLLQYMPPGLDQKGWKDMGPLGNWPRCGHCESLARPAILMFGDFGFHYDLPQHERWDAWKEAVMDLTKSKSEKEGIQLKVCILEIGCGINVSTCRDLSETTVHHVARRGGEPTLIRINPDHPGAPKEFVAADHIISIPSRGLEAIRRIDEIYKTLNQES